MSCTCVAIVSQVPQEVGTHIQVCYNRWGVLFRITNFIVSKTLVYLQDTVSVHKPGFYMKRFYEFVSTKVFKKEPKGWTSSKVQ